MTDEEQYQCATQQVPCETVAQSIAHLDRLTMNARYGVPLRIIDVVLKLMLIAAIGASSLIGLRLISLIEVFNQYYRVRPADVQQTVEDSTEVILQEITTTKEILQEERAQ